ncbi:MAG: hypothetical protein ACREDT_10785 [Methylocella sp.]
MKNFSDLSEWELLALAITFEKRTAVFTATYTAFRDLRFERMWEILAAAVNPEVGVSRAWRISGNGACASSPGADGRDGSSVEIPMSFSSNKRA